MVIVIVNGTPVLSPTILVCTSVEGDFVGKGPSVSELVTEHADEDDPEDEPEPEDEPVVVSVISSSLPHRIKIGAATAVTPAKPRVFKNPFLSIVFIICFFKGYYLNDFNFILSISCNKCILKKTAYEIYEVNSKNVSVNSFFLRNIKNNMIEIVENYRIEIRGGKNSKNF